MIGDQRVLALIPARGGSKGLPGKNICLVRDRPLIDWTIEAARSAPSIDRLIVSTEDDAIAATALALGCEVPFRRPMQLSTDTATSVDVALHALDQVQGYDVVILLQPTSPLRLGSDIEAACALLRETGVRSCVSVAAVDTHPYWMYYVTLEHRLQSVLAKPSQTTRRQELPPVYALNGAVYVAAASFLREHRSFMSTETVAYVMPADRSLDIDTSADFEVFRNVIEKRHAS